MSGVRSVWEDNGGERGRMSEKRFQNSMVVLRMLHNRSVNKVPPLTAWGLWRTTGPVYGRWNWLKRADFAATILRGCRDLVKVGLAIEVRTDDGKPGWSVSPIGSLVAVQHRTLVPPGAWTQAGDSR